MEVTRDEINQRGGHAVLPMTFPTRLMGLDVMLVTQGVSCGVSYELYRSVDRPAFIRVYDVDSGNVVNITQYRTFDAAQREHTRIVEEEYLADYNARPMNAAAQEANDPGNYPDGAAL